MYNSEQKQTFLNTITNDNSYRSFQRVFKAVQDMEEKFGKDICEMNVDELLTVLDFKTGVRITNTEQTMSLLRSYVDWCIQNGKTTSENNFDKISSSEVDKTRTCRARYVKSPVEFEEMIKIAFGMNVDYNESAEIPNELMVRLCYVGLENEEIVLLEKTNVDYEAKTIKSPLYDCVYHVSDRILKLCKFCAEQEEVLLMAKFGMRKERVCSNKYLFRNRLGTLRGKSEDSPLNKLVIPRKVKAFSDAYVESTGNYKAISCDKLRESKMLYNIYESGETFDIYFNKVILPDIKMRNPEYTERKIQERRRILKGMYDLYKETFY